jgi:MFS family permease
VSSSADKNVTKLYILTALTNLWFITGSWLYFYRLYMSDRQIGILDGLVFGIGLIAEIPSGAMADLLGRRRQLQLGLLLTAGGFLMQGFAQAYWYILVGMVMFTVGMAFVSGSDDALVYDSLDAEGKSNLWEKVIARKFQIMHAVTIASYLIGGLLYILHFRLPFILAGVGFLLAFFVATTFRETREVSDNLSMKAYIRQNTEGMRHLFKRHMWLYAFMALAILGIGYAFDLGVIKPLILDSFGFKENAQAVINAVASGVAIIAISQLDRLRKSFGEKRGLVILALIMGIGFLVSSFPIAIALGLVAFLMIFAVNSLAEPWLNDVVQHEVPSSHRATALSTLALLQKLPYVILAPIAGALSLLGDFSLFLIGVAICLFAAVVLLLLFGVLTRTRTTRTKDISVPTIKEDRDLSAQDIERLE